MVGKIVRVTSPSRSRPRKVSVSIRCETPPIRRLISLKRFGPSNSTMMTKTLHLSPTRARIEATPRQSACSCGDGGRAGTLMFAGFKNVPEFQKSAFLWSWQTVTHIAQVTNQYQGAHHEKTAPHRFQRPRPAFRQPASFGGHRRPAAPDGA